MTLIVNRPVSGAQTHAIVIAVGHYPHLEGGLTPRRDTLDLKQLTSPPHCALAMAKWLRERYRNPEAPLATLELLISAGPVEVTAPGDSGEVLIERAIMANARQAIIRWAERANTRRDHVTVFYFCGHGVAAGTLSGLLLEDFGSDHSDFRLLDNLIDLDGLHLGMDRCKARRQAYFIDACRTTPHAVAACAVKNGIGDPILNGPSNLDRNGPRPAPIFYACLPGQQAEADRDSVSVFTGALIETLDSGGAANRNDRWVVPTDSILAGLRAAVERRGSGAPEPVADKMAGFDLHVLDGPPEVPVSVDCNPTAANQFAALSLVGRSKTHERPPEQARWELQCRVGTYDVCARFEVDRYRSVRREEELVAPPGRKFKLDVGR